MFWGSSLETFPPRALVLSAWNNTQRHKRDALQFITWYLHSWTKNKRLSIRMAIGRLTGVSSLIHHPPYQPCHSGVEKWQGEGTGLCSVSVMVFVMLPARLPTFLVLREYSFVLHREVPFITISGGIYCDEFTSCSFQSSTIMLIISMQV